MGRKNKTENPCDEEGGEERKEGDWKKKKQQDASVQNLGSFTVQVGTGKCTSTYL